MPVLIDESFNLELNVRGLNVAIKNLNNLNYKLAAEYGENSDRLTLHGLIGSDVLQHLDFKTVNCMAGKALQINSGLLPFGNRAFSLS